MSETRRARAERILDVADGRFASDRDAAADGVAAAQVHATLDVADAIRELAGALTARPAPTVAEEPEVLTEEPTEEGAVVEITVRFTRDGGPPCSHAWRTWDDVWFAWLDIAHQSHDGVRVISRGDER